MTTATITEEQVQDIRTFMSEHHIPAGLGDEESACTIAAGNFVLTGVLTDDIPPCMSEVIGKWIIPVQDAMPDSVRNSAEWIAAASEAFGSGREHEAERLQVLLDWLFGTVLPYLQPQADADGYGAEWLRMTTERTEAATEAAEDAARAAGNAAWQHFDPVGVLVRLNKVGKD